MKKYVVSVFALAMFLTVSSCSVLWNLGNVGGLKKDVIGVLKSAGVETKIKKARMVDLSRMGVCMVELSEEEAMKIVGELGLQKVEVDNLLDESESQKVFNSIAYTIAGEKEYKEVLRGGDLSHYVIGRRKKTGNMVFEFFALYYNAKTKKALIHVSYAYG